MFLTNVGKFAKTEIVAEKDEKIGEENRHFRVAFIHCAGTVFSDFFLFFQPHCIARVYGDVLVYRQKRYLRFTFRTIFGYYNERVNPFVKPLAERRYRLRSRFDFGRDPRGSSPRTISGRRRLRTHTSSVGRLVGREFLIITRIPISIAHFNNSIIRKRFFFPRPARPAAENYSIYKTCRMQRSSRFLFLRPEECPASCARPPRSTGSSAYALGTSSRHGRIISFSAAARPYAYVQQRMFSLYFSSCTPIFRFVFIRAIIRTVQYHLL